jgi:hypothetical protein
MGGIILAALLSTGNYQTMITADTTLLNKGVVVSSKHYSTPNSDTNIAVPVPLGMGWRCSFTKPILRPDGKWQSTLNCSSWNGAFKVSNQVKCSASESSEDFQLINLVNGNNPNIIVEVSIMCYTFQNTNNHD